MGRNVHLGAWRRAVPLGVAAFLTACSGTSAPADAGPGDAGDPCAALMAAARERLDAERPSLGFVGLVLTIETPRCGARTIASGQASIDPPAAIGEASTMSIGSTSKTFLAAVVLQLVHEGTLSLDDTLATLYPSFHTEHASEITLRDLLAMRSGVPDYFGATGCYGVRMTQPSTPDELLACVDGDPALRAPDTGFDYSNTNFVLLGAIVEHATGMTLHELVHARLLTPLGLAHTGYLADAVPPSGLVRSYLVGSDITGLWDPSYVFGAGDLVSSTPDLARWIRALVTGDVVPMPERDAMQAFQPADVDVGPARTDTDYGLGLERRVAHAADGSPVCTLLGHPGRWDAMVEAHYVPEWDAAVAIGTNEATITSGEENVWLLNEMLDRTLVALAPRFEALQP